MKLTASVIGLTLVLFARGSLAQSAPSGSSPERAAAAQALYEKAVEAMDKSRDFARACPQLEEVVRLIPEGVGAKITLAECYEGLGRLASAWTTYSSAESAAEMAKQPERAKKAHDRAVALRARLSELTIVVPAAVRALSGLEITRDGIPVGSAFWDVGIPVDKGAHVIVVRANGKSSTKTLSIPADGSKVSFTVDAVDAGEATTAPTNADSSPISAPPVEPDGTPGFWTTRRALGAGVGALGLIGLGTSFAFGAQAISKKNESNAGPCDATNHCTPQGLALRADGRSAGTVATVFFFVGLAATGAGVVLFATAPSPTSSVGLVVGPGSIGARGKF